jgi:tetratricopeptide (TPR) repeat protein/phage FluMu protein Com
MGDIRFCCRVCGQKLAIDSVAAGWEIRCPKCGTSQTAPPAPAPDQEAASKSSTSSTEPQSAIPEFARREQTGGEEFEYEAFISYRHVEPDRTLAKWLHTALETYRIPKKLVAERGLPGRLKKLFRDEDELPASADLSKEIERALHKSRFLIVVCSPRTPASEWVNAEVAFFRALGRNDQILALLIEGEPGESFPQALREIRRTVVEQTGTTRETIENVEPLAADVRPGRKETQRRLRTFAKLRILASLLGIPFDALRQRERARERIIRIRLIALITFAAIGIVLALKTNNAENNAERQMLERAVNRRVTGFGVLNKMHAAKIEHLTKAVKLNPSDFQSHYNLGVLLAGQGRLPEAIEHYERVLQLIPDFDKSHLDIKAQACLNLGIVLGNQGKPSEAISNLQKALALAEAQHDILLAMTISNRLKDYQPAPPSPRVP